MKRKIAFFIGHLSGGGAERVVSNLASGFAEDGYDTTVITSIMVDNEYRLSPLVKRICLNENRKSGNRLKNKIHNQAALRVICQKEKYDVLISFMPSASYHAIAATIGKKTKTIVSVRNDPSREYAGMGNGLMAKYFLPLADGCVFQTNEAMEWFPKRLRKKSRIIFNPVNDKFYTVRPNLQGNNLVAAGRLEPQKNYNLLLDVFQEVLKTHSDAKLFIYGTGSEEKKIRTKITASKIEQNVFLCGHCDSLQDKFSKTDIFVLTSDYEGMPNSLMEAMASGLPCVAVDCPSGGVTAVLEKGKYGELIPLGDRHALKASMCRLLSDQEYRYKLAVLSKERAEAFRIEKILKKWEDYIEYVINK